MKIVFLGAGAAFSSQNYQPNFIVEVDGKILLIDAGTDIRFSLKDSNYKITDIDSIFISHTHADHIGGLEYIAFNRYFNNNIPIPNLFTHASINENLWSNSLRGGLGFTEGRIMAMSDYFNVTSVQHDLSFTWQGVKFNLVKITHVNNGFIVVPTFGLFFQTPKGKKVFFTSDTQFTPVDLSKYYEEADFIIQDCETSSFRTIIHANYDDLKTLSNEIKQKMHLWHYQDNVVQSPEEWNQKAKDDNFAGFIKKGEIWEL